jgi:hypothetical protein
MMSDSPWTRFRQGVSYHLQKGAHRLGPAVPRVLAWFSDVSREGITRLHTASWHTCPRELKAVLLLIVAGLLLSIIIYGPPWLESIKNLGVIHQSGVE